MKNNQKTTQKNNSKKTPQGATQQFISKKETQELLIGQAKQKKNIRVLSFILFAFAFVLYGKTLFFNQYVLDDDFVTRLNKFVVMGIKGIPDIITKGSLFGFNGVNESHYRPLTLINFCIETQFFGLNPKVNHFFNVFFYGLSGVFLFLFLRKIFKTYTLAILFIITAIFMAHPIHTEVVANIKSRDEILSFLLATCSLLSLFNYVENNKLKTYLLSICLFFLSLLSKESALTFVAVIPLLLYFFSEFKIKKIILLTMPYVGVVLLYILIRWVVLDSITFNDKQELINNSLMAAKTTSEALATNTMVMGKYLGLLFSPHPLSWDYSYNQVPISTWTNMKVIISLAVYLFLGCFTIIKFGKKNIFAFCILYFVVTISLVSNIFLKIGASFGERFLYAPSLAFCIALIMLATWFLKIDVTGKSKKNYTTLIVGSLVLLSIYMWQTIDRSEVWKNNMSLFLAGVKDSPNSARAHRSLAYEYTALAQASSNNPQAQAELYKKAIEEFKIGLYIYPEHAEAWYSLGYALYLSGNYDDAMLAYKKTVTIYPKYPQAYNNMGIIQLDRKQYNAALISFKKAVEIANNHIDALGNIGYTYHNMGIVDSAIFYYNKALILNPQLSDIRKNMESLINLKNQQQK